MRFVSVLILSLSAVLAADSNPLTDAVKSRYQSARQNLVETADLMPEDAYGFRLTAPQRPFGEWISHTAMGNYMFCSAMKGEKPPDMQQLHHGTGKADLTRALAESFAYCDAVLQEMSDQKALAPVTSRAKTTYPVQAMVSLVASLNEHYGNLVGYLRSKGLTPPSTARAQKQKK